MLHDPAICNHIFLTIYRLPSVIYRLSKQHTHIQPRTCAEAHIRLLDVANITNVIVFSIITGNSQWNTCSTNRRHVQLHENVILILEYSTQTLQTCYSRNISVKICYDHSNVVRCTSKIIWPITAKFLPQVIVSAAKTENV